MFKKILFPLMLIAVCVVACACFGGNQTETAPQATNNPQTSPGQDGAVTSPAPTSSANTTNPDGANAPPANQSASSSGQTQTGFDWITGSGAVADRINMFSEIDSCSIVESEGTALVGVEFADAYQGELTQRIRDMVAGEVMAADSSIQVVAVTNEKDDVAKIKELSSQISQGNTPQDIKQQVDMIARNTTTLR